MRYSCTFLEAGIIHRITMPADSPAHAFQRCASQFPDATRILVSVPSHPTAA
jgi:hypothetical protein